MSQLNRIGFLKCTALASAMMFTAASNAALVDHYEFEGDGIDSAGGDANGTVGVNVTFTPGVFGQAAAFPGGATIPANMIEVPPADTFDPGTGGFTVAHWVKRNNAGSNVFEQTIDGLNGTGEGYQTFFLNNAGNNLMRVRLDDVNGNNIVADTDTQFNDSDFHHIAFVVDRTANTLTFYVDGVLDSTHNSLNTLVGAISPDQGLQIGRDFVGEIDDLRFYNEALDAAAISALIPEPSSLALLGLGGLVMSRRRRN